MTSGNGGSELARRDGGVGQVRKGAFLEGQLLRSDSNDPHVETQSPFSKTRNFM